MKVLIFWEDYEYILWDQQMIDILGNHDDPRIVEVPDALVDEYLEYTNIRATMMDKLREIYDRQRKPQSPT